jgi:7-dehydrocholesterol reductase
MAQTNNQYFTNAPIFRNLSVLLIIVLTIPAAIVFWYTSHHLDGSFMNLFGFFMDRGFFNGMWEIWSPVFLGSKTAWSILGIYAAVELLLMKVLPGKKVYGPRTPNGYTPEYKNNGFLAFLVSIFLLWLFGFQLKVFDPSIIYDHFGEILGALNIFSLLFCLLLYFKGIYKPSTPDSGTSGNALFDYYWGTDLYPHILGFNVKHFTNSRFGMMAWPLLIIVFAAKQHELYGISDSMLVSVFLQLVYCGTFFFYESGYFKTMDIQEDRAGYYIVWGVMVWIPAVYTLTAHYLVIHPVHLGMVFSAVFIIVGLLSFWVKTNMNRQRINVRKHDGDYNIWGHKAKIIRANYIDQKGEKHDSILLVDGWWGISRHFHYVGEILGALCWSLPALFVNFMPYFYVVFLAILLFHRANRDNVKCQLKYGKYWDEYRQAVPYKVIPGVY